LSQYHGAILVENALAKSVSEDEWVEEVLDEKK